MKNKIIIPLDVDSEEKAVELVSTLKDHVGAFKVGLELINNVGFGIFDKIKAAGAKKYSMTANSVIYQIQLKVPL